MRLKNIASYALVCMGSISAIIGVILLYMANSGQSEDIDWAMSISVS